MARSKHVTVGEADTGKTTPPRASLHPRKATAADLPQVTDTLSLAFYDDPVVTWCIADGPRRRQLLPRFFRAVAESFLDYDVTYALGDVISTAVWAPPDARDDERLPTVLGEAVEEYADRLFEMLEAMAEQHPVAPHYYLFLVGTRPDWQGCGFGSSLLAATLQTCDRERMPAYLEATSERNKQLYIRHDFEVTDEIKLRDGPTMSCMWRSPR